MKSARDPAMDTQSATCVSPGTAEFRISELMLFNTPPQTSSIMFFSWVSADAVSNICTLIMCVVLHFDKIVVGHEMIVKFLSKWWQQLSLAETLQRLA